MRNCRKLRKSSNSRGAPGSEDGVVLLLVLWVVALISVLALSWAQDWRTELKLAANYREVHQCRRLAEAGIYYAVGKMVAAKSAEAQGPQGTAGQGPSIWQGDQSLHELKLPGGWADIRVGDEGGKINLNLASERILANLFIALGFTERDVVTMVNSILDWRTDGETPRPFGAKSDYYLRLDPPYPAKNGKFEVVQELAWVRGFRGSPFIARLSNWLTVQPIGQAININTAPLEVLEAAGLAPDVASQVVETRQAAPFQNLQGLPPVMADPTSGLVVNFMVRSSPFFTITSTGRVKKKGARHTITAVVRINPNSDNLWEIISWMDDFPA